MTRAPNEEPEPYVIPLSPDGREVLSVSTAEGKGWAAYHSPATQRAGATVLLRLGPEDGPSGQPIIINGEPRLAYPVNHAEESALEIRELHVAVGRHTPGFTGTLPREIPFTRIEAAINHPKHRPHLTKLVMPANAIRVGEQPGGARYAFPPTEPPNVQPPSLRVEDPGGYRKPDDFYRRVADLYLWLASMTARPAQELAEANGVPPATVHRWIREAKARRLLLLPRHKGPSGAERAPIRFELADDTSAAQYEQEGEG